MTTSTHTVKLSIAGLNMAFRDVNVLHDISMDIPTGRKTVLIGPAASGKTVLMKCVAGIHMPSSGTIRLDDHLITGISLSIWPLESANGVFWQGSRRSRSCQMGR